MIEPEALTDTERAIIVAWCGGVIEARGGGKREREARKVEPQFKPDRGKGRSNGVR